MAVLPRVSYRDLLVNAFLMITIPCFAGVAAQGDKPVDVNSPLQLPDNQWYQRADSHPCVRECIEGEAPMTCQYTFELEWYYTLSKACYDCPFNGTDCDRTDCIVADGFKRPVVVVNRQLPGPSVEVCLGDRIIVDFVNHMMDESSTIHWHGMYQRGTQYMDGVPFVTQCPVQPRSTFRYSFEADNHGTHFWHAHSGVQRGDGVFGSLIVRRPVTTDPHSVQYDYDLPSHTIQLIDWCHEDAISKYLNYHHSSGDNNPVNLLVNGRARFNLTTETEGETRQHNFTEASFTVEQGYRYRFRVINAGFLMCPVQVSVDNHTLLIIAADGGDLEPVTAESFALSAGERWDFVLEANQPVDNYWIRFRGLLNCAAHQVAVLHYTGASLYNEPEAEVSYEAAQRGGLSVNALNFAMNDNETLILSELKSIVEEDISLKPQADVTHYISYDINLINNPTYNKPGLYGIDQVAERIFTPQFNYITMKMPSAPPLSQPDDLDAGTICNSATASNCTENFCECTHILKVPLGAVVELVFIDIGSFVEISHPLHLHGTSFRVVASDRLGTSTSVEQVIALDQAGLIERNLESPPVKDTASVPDGGYTIVRFHASNPGFWFFHCHLEYHVELGMAIIFQVGEPSDFPPVPQGFPQCGSSFVPDEDDSEIEGMELRKGSKITSKLQKRPGFNSWVN